MPKVSVIIPTYNRAGILLRAIESVLNQSFINYEIVLVDDGSTDETAELFLNFSDDHRIKYFFQGNSGVAKARNLGAEKAKSDWLIFLDSDDELETNALGYFHENIVLNPSCRLFIAGNSQISASSTIIKLPKRNEYYSILSGTFCIDKGLFFESGGYDVKLSFSENTELFHRINMIYDAPCFLTNVSLLYHENASGGSKNLTNMVDSLLYFLSKHNDTLSVRNKHLYHQIIGVNQMRFRNFSVARIHLLQALKLQPNISTIARWGISYIVPLAKLLYKEKV